MKRRLLHRLRGSERGQSLIEMAAILPLLLLITLGSLEFGMVFDHHLSLEYATREGARTGAALANADGETPACNDIDKQVVAAVERVLTSPGSDIDLAQVNEIRIYRAKPDGTEEPGDVNVWTYTPGAGPLVDDARLDFSEASNTWYACTRVNLNVDPDLLGVSISYDYGFRTALGGLLGDSSIAMTDRTVMTLNPL